MGLQSIVPFAHRLIRQQHFVVFRPVFAGSGLFWRGAGGCGASGDQAKAAARLGSVVIRCARRRRTSPSVTAMRPLQGFWGPRRRDGAPATTTLRPATGQAWAQEG